MHICTCISGISNQEKRHGRKITSTNIPFFFDTLQLKTVYSEPYALNAAPNKTFKKVALEYLRQYVTTLAHLISSQPLSVGNLPEMSIREKRNDFLGDQRIGDFFCEW
jgi:hypothetical protein